MKESRRLKLPELKEWRILMPLDSCFLLINFSIIPFHGEPIHYKTAALAAIGGNNYISEYYEELITNGLTQLGPFRGNRCDISFYCVTKS